VDQGGNAGMRPHHGEKAKTLLGMAPSIPGTPEEVVMTHSIGYIDRDSCAKQPTPQLSLRTNRTNPNHHLWNNNGTWYICYTVCEPGLSGTRRRESLRTKSITTARRLRDRVLTEQPVACLSGRD